MIAVQITNKVEGIPVEAARLGRLVRAVCKRFQVVQVAVSVAVVGDAEMRRLNRKFLNRRTNTDCLSFDLSDGAGPEAPRVFDLIVNGELAFREAARRGHSPEAELALYVTHGLLHNLGLDDATPGAAGRMHRMEDEILQHSGYGSVYNSGDQGS
jgi:probable rRNA maturation factor